MTQTPAPGPNNRLLDVLLVLLFSLLMAALSGMTMYLLGLPLAAAVGTGGAAFLGIAGLLIGIVNMYRGGGGS